MEHGHIDGFEIQEYKVDEKVLAWYNGTRAANRIDRMTVPDEALAFYDRLIEGADNDGVDDILIEDAYFDGDHKIHVMTVTGTISMTDSKESLQTARENIFRHVTCINNVSSAFGEDHPEVFWFVGGMTDWDFTYTPDGHYTANIWYLLHGEVNGQPVDIRMEEYQSEEQIKEGIAIRDARISEILKTSEGKNTYQKLAYFNDILTSTNAYNSNDKNASYLHRISLCALEGNVGPDGPVCASYAKAYKVLCDAADIPCVVVGGPTKYSSFSVDIGFHQWNYIQLDDQWYAVDVTWNDSPDYENGPDSSYDSIDWFLLGSDTIRDGIPFGGSHTLSTSNINPPILSKNAYTK